MLEQPLHPERLRGAQLAEAPVNAARIRRVVAGSSVRSVLLFCIVAASPCAQALGQLPHLVEHGTATQLVVDGRPFLIRGGEIGNSTATNPDYLAQYWPKFQELNLNTLLVPVYWDLIEPEEGRFDFSTVDRTIEQAREHDMKLVLLWFGSWKNSMSCYAPGWVKRDSQRFPRAKDRSGVPQEILTPFSNANRDADVRAFGALQSHLRDFDGAEHTVVMIQVENEIGMIPTARDHSAEGNRAFKSAVPTALMDYLASHRDTLTPELRAAWLGAGGNREGNWTDVFGDSIATEEIFMAWHFATYTEAVAAAGKREYALPMFVNAALIRPGHQPGQYPSAGPLPHLIDIWRAGAPSIDFLSPDIYFQNFAEWARRYHRPGNPLFIPEAMRSTDASVNGLYAFGAHDAMGFSPFAIESIGEPAGKYLAASFDLVAQLEPLLLARQGKGGTAGFLSEGPEQRQPQQVPLGDFVLSASFERGVLPSLADGMFVPGANPVPAAPPPSGGLAIELAPNEFIIAGTGLVITFASREPGKIAGIESAEEGHFVDGEWQNLRWLGGDQTHQGRHVRLESGRFSLQRVKLYTY